MRKGEIYLVELFSKRGREQKGMRPGIVVADTKTSLALIVPLTSNLESLNKFHFTLEIKKSLENNLNQDSVALVFHLQALDKIRLKKKIGVLDDEIIFELDELLKKMFCF